MTIIIIRVLTVKQYLEEHYVDKSFAFLELLKALQPDPDDRELIEKEIQGAINDIHSNETSETALVQLVHTIAISYFRILRSRPVVNYWNMLKLRQTSLQNAADDVDDVQRSYKRYNTISHELKNQSDKVYESDSIILTDMTRSVGSLIKTEAIIKEKTAKVFNKLNNDGKNTVALGLNSICDLSNSSNSEGSQKSLFTEKAWKQLKNKSYVSREMPPLPDRIERDLLKIEKLALENLEKAYQLQIQYALTPDEIYAHVIRLLNKNKYILKRERSKLPTEQDFVGEVWTPIISAIFNDRYLYMNQEKNFRKRKELTCAL